MCARWARRSGGRRRSRAISPTGASPGDGVAPVVKYHNATAADLVVVSDDIDLPVGRIRIRKGGSAGGHNGLKSVIERLGTPDFILPEQLKVLDESALEGVPSLTLVDAHSCAAIGRDAFKGTGLEQIRLPKDCEIDPEAFGEQRICVFAPAGGTTEAFCADDDNLVFVAEAE